MSRDNRTQTADVDKRESKQRLGLVKAPFLFLFLNHLIYEVIYKFWILLIAFPIEQADFNQSLTGF